VAGLPGMRRDGERAAELKFVVQLHDATTLHYDFRLEWRGVLVSWAVPKGPSLDPAVKRLAVPVPDHALSHGDYEGRRVIIWDAGTWEPREGTPDDGHFSFFLHGEKLRGGFALTKTGDKQWLLVKMADDAARRGSDIGAERPESVRSGRSITD
jgi:DNA ligase D-like protein (predicted 3'-phosphoesterase)